MSQEKVRHSRNIIELSWVYRQLSIEYGPASCKDIWFDEPFGFAIYMHGERSCKNTAISIYVILLPNKLLRVLLLAGFAQELLVSVPYDTIPNGVIGGKIRSMGYV